MARVLKSNGETVEVPDEDVWPAETTQQVTARRLDEAKAECKRRIYAVADEIAQINLAAAAGAGLLTPAELLTYRSGLQWVDAMRQNCGALATDHDANIFDDASWPAVPAGVTELADKY